MAKNRSSARRSQGETRSITATQSSPDILRIFGLDALGNSAGESVTIESALGVPAIWAPVNFLASTIAGLPLKVYNRAEAGREESTGPLGKILSGVVNVEDLTSSFTWRKWWMEQALTGGRGVTFIERNARGQVLNLWPLEPDRVTIKRQDRRKFYEYKDSGRKPVVYEASEVLDLPFMLAEDGLRHRSPIFTNREVVGLAQAVTKYGAAFFRNGGVPPFAVTGNFQSPGAMDRAADDLDQAVRKTARDARQALILPRGLEIKPIGADAEKSQLIETQRFVVEQFARIYSLPPVFLQDLTHGTFSNTEQQDLHLVKHTIKRWVEQIEHELNLKLFGRGSKSYVEFSLDGLLRGDFKTRMEGYATAIQNGIKTPNEVRKLENLPPLSGGEQLMIQGATVPLTDAKRPPDGTDQGAADRSEMHAAVMRWLS